MISLINDDCFNAIKSVSDNSVDLIIIDPPYLTTNEDWDKEEVVNGALPKELFRVAKDSCSIYIWCGIGEKSQSLIRWFPIFQKDWYFKDLITWKKQRGIGMRRAGFTQEKNVCGSLKIINNLLGIKKNSIQKKNVALI
jgi:site-specific DNA-methyltransferase (adenine-specific)